MQKLSTRSSTHRIFQMNENKAISVELVDNIAIIDILEKRVYSQFVEKFREAMQDFNSENHQKVIFNFSNVNMINSAGIGVLISTQHALMQNDGKLVICGLNNLLKEIFFRMRLDLIFDIKDDVLEGIKALK